MGRKVKPETGYLNSLPTIVEEPEDAPALAALLKREQLPDGFVSEVICAIASYRRAYETWKLNPSKAEVLAGVKAMYEAARTLDELLGDHGADTGGALGLIQMQDKGVGERLLPASREVVSSLRARTHTALQDFDRMAAANPNILRFHDDEHGNHRRSIKTAQHRMAADLARLIASIELPVTISVRGGLPNSPYTRLVEWSLRRAETTTRSKDGQRVGNFIPIAQAGKRHYEAGG